MACSADHGRNNGPNQVQTRNVTQQPAQWRHDGAHSVRNGRYGCRFLLGHVVLVLQVSSAKAKVTLSGSRDQDRIGNGPPDHGEQQSLKKLVRHYPAIEMNGKMAT